MATIVAGNFEGETQAEKALQGLKDRGIPLGEVCSFFVNPPGQHATYPIGGDREESPGAVDADRGAVTGASVGAAIGLGVGLAATPFLGPVAAVGGAGAGAYTGALVGALNDMGEKKGDPDGRLAGVIVAVNVPDQIAQGLAANALSEFDARQIEIAEGTWVGGKWVDFDPLTSPRLISRYQAAADTRAAHQRL